MELQNHTDLDIGFMIEFPPKPGQQGILPPKELGPLLPYSNYALPLNMIGQGEGNYLNDLKRKKN